MFIDWELIKRGRPLIPSLQKVMFPLMCRGCFVSQHKCVCCNVSFAPRPLFCMVRASPSVTALIVVVGNKIEEKKSRGKRKQMVPITYITCRQCM